MVGRVTSLSVKPKPGRIRTPKQTVSSLQLRAAEPLGISIAIASRAQWRSRFRRPAPDRGHSRGAPRRGLAGTAESPWRKRAVGGDSRCSARIRKTGPDRRRAARGDSRLRSLYRTGRTSYVGEARGPEFIRTLHGRRGWYARVIQEGTVELTLPRSSFPRLSGLSSVEVHRLEFRMLRRPGIPAIWVVALSSSRSRRRSPRCNNLRTDPAQTAQGRGPSSLADHSRVQAALDSHGARAPRTPMRSFLSSTSTVIRRR
jgi:hypothetical protein